MHSCFSRVQFFATLWTVARQAPLSLDFFTQEYWSGLPCPLPGDLPDPGIKPESLRSPALAGGFFITSATWEACLCFHTPEQRADHLDLLLAGTRLCVATRPTGHGLSPGLVAGV